MEKIFLSYNILHTNAINANQSILSLFLVLNLILRPMAITLTHYFIFLF